MHLAARGECSAPPLEAAMEGYLRAQMYFLHQMGLIAGYNYVETGCL